jgi:GNAT superfamily N-acetyltransferase
VADMSGDVIRPARTDDAARIAALSATLGYPVTTGDLAPRLGRLAGSGENIVLVAERDGIVVGWIHAAEQDLLESERRCEILGLVVDDRARRGGVGRRLVAEVEQWAGRRGIGLLSVRSATSRLESHPFYERLGYQRVKSQHVYRKKLEP